MSRCGQCDAIVVLLCSTWSPRQFAKCQSMVTTIVRTNRWKSIWWVWKSISTILAWWPGGSVALGHLGCWTCSTQRKIWQRSHFMRSRTTDRCHFGREVFQLDRGKIHSGSQHQFHWPIFSESSLHFQRFLYIHHSRAKESSSLFQMMADEDGQVSYSRFMDGMNRAKGLAKAAACLVRSVRNWGRLF